MLKRHQKLAGFYSLFPHFHPDINCILYFISGYFQDILFDEVEELHFVAAEGEVIQAVDLCVVLMNTGEVAEIMADPEMAYGKLK